MKETWDSLWALTNRGLSDDMVTIQNLQRSRRMEYFQQVIERKFGGFRGLRTLELGAGRGEISLCMALAGFEAFLVDYSSKAQEAAESLWRGFGLSPLFIRADLFQLPANLFGVKIFPYFDIVMSYGLVEHFVGLERQMVFDIHYSLVRPGGMAIISVPHCAGVVYWAYRFAMTAAKRRYKYGIEVNMTPKTWTPPYCGVDLIGI